LITDAADAFITARDSIFQHTHEIELLEADSTGSNIYATLKEFAKAHAYNHPTVLRTELQGTVAVSRLLDWLWEAISSREDEKDPRSRRSSAFATYAYALISDNYRCEFEDIVAKSELPFRYHELQLLADVVSGMTDGFVMELFHDLGPLHHA
jgi:dGTPase